MEQERLIYKINNDFLFFFPSREKITLNRIIGTDKELNMPIVEVDINKNIWLNVIDNEMIENILISLQC